MDRVDHHPISLDHLQPGQQPVLVASPRTKPNNDRFTVEIHDGTGGCLKAAADLVHNKNIIIILPNRLMSSI